MKRLTTTLVYVLLMVGSANALTLSSVDGDWSNPVGGMYIHYQNGQAIGYGNGLEDRIRWGDPVPVAEPHGEPVESQSGLGFTGIAPLALMFDVGDVFQIGQLRHFNFVVDVGPPSTAATAVDLTISLTFGDPINSTADVDFTFNINETLNEPGPVDDIITFSSPPGGQTFVSGGMVYTLTLLGFGPEAGSLMTEFQSPENGINGTKLWGVITAEPVEPGEPKVDIKPTSCPNPLNVNSNGVLPVAILGSEAYDVTQIDPSTILLEGVPPLRYSYEDVAAPVGPDAEYCECTTAGSDGYLDLTLKFHKQAIVAAIGEVADGELVELILTWLLLDETEQQGSDCVVIRKKGR